MIRFRSRLLYLRRSSMASGLNLIANMLGIHCISQ
jgi:hypothetical protein